MNQTRNRELRDEDQGLRPIGDLIKASWPSPSGSASTPSGSSTSSAITGSQSLAKTPASTTGPARGGTGVAIRPSVDLQEAVRAQDTAQIDRAVVASLPPQVQSLLECHRTTGGRVMAYSLLYPLPKDAPEDDIRRSLAIVEQACRPSSPELTIKEITRCLLVTKARAGDADDTRARIAIFAEELTGYPSDVIREACRRWSRSNAFAPSLAELRNECEKAFSFRVTLKESLERAVNRMSRASVGAPSLPASEVDHG